MARKEEKEHARQQASERRWLEKEGSCQALCRPRQSDQRYYQEEEYEKQLKKNDLNDQLTKQAQNSQQNVVQGNCYNI